MKNLLVEAEYKQTQFILSDNNSKNENEYEKYFINILILTANTKFNKIIKYYTK